MSDKKVTERGFRIYDDTIEAHHGKIRVQESSIAFEGAHTWIFYDDIEAKEGIYYPSIQINVANAKKLVVALQAFIQEAEDDKLTEPA
jgi:hypothetical protein